jgi:hypothetical protein
MQVDEYSIHRSHRSVKAGGFDNRHPAAQLLTDAHLGLCSRLQFTNLGLVEGVIRVSIAALGRGPDLANEPRSPKGDRWWVPPA